MAPRTRAAFGATRASNAECGRAISGQPDHSGDPGRCRTQCCCRGIGSARGFRRARHTAADGSGRHLALAHFGACGSQRERHRAARRRIARSTATMNALIVTGTDTAIGKTVVCAMLTLALDAYYWKPIQSGLSGATDTATVAALTGLPSERLLPERYRLRQPLSPHRAAELDGIEIDWHSIDLPAIPP